jgi:hypothetical protein
MTVLRDADTLEWLQSMDQELYEMQDALTEIADELVQVLEDPAHELISQIGDVKLALYAYAERFRAKVK